MIIKHSKQEIEFLIKHNLTSNETRFIVKAFKDTRIKDIYYIPDSVKSIAESIVWIEYKGFHKSMSTYLLKRKLIKEHCLNNGIIFCEVKKKKKEYLWKIFNDNNGIVKKWIIANESKM